MLLVLAAAALPDLCGGAEPAPAHPKGATQKQSQAEDDEGAALAADVGEFELRVVGPDGKPVPEALVEFRRPFQPTADQIKRGKFVRQAAYGVFWTADGEGRLVVKISAKLEGLDVNITTPGFGPYWARWSSDGEKQAVPARFTAELESGWSVGGVVVDSDGKPVAGVKVHPRIEYKKRPGDTGQLGVGAQQTTDASGKWHFDSVPASMSEIFVEMSHPDFKPERRPLTRSEFGIKPGQGPAAQVVLDHGLTVAGTVTDTAGQPIAGALVRTKFLNDIRDAKTGADGRYRLQGCEPRRAKIVVSAKGRATDMQEVAVEPDMPPVDFQMRPGGKVRIRVVDEKGNPIPKARIFFQRWRGPSFSYFEFDHIGQYADERGIWEWNEAPRDGFEADICRPDGMQLAHQPLIARDEEYVFRPPPALVISGSVVDAVTRKPVPKFNVVRGIRSSETEMNWVRQDEKYVANDGTYRVRIVHDYLAHLVRIEAAGYRPAVSRDIKSNEGQVTIDFALEQGPDAAATVVTSQGQPAAGARVALGVAGSQISIKNGAIDDGSTYCARQDTDAAGKFRFPSQDSDFQIVITHPAGYAHVKATPDSMPATIKLVPWAKVEGTFRVGKDPVAGVPITMHIETLSSYGEDVPRIFTHYDLTTGKEGRFAFDRVIAGHGRIGRRIMLMANEGATDVTSSCMIPAEFATGERTQIDLGGTGRPVVGRLQPPKNFQGAVKWNFALIDVGPQLAEPPMPNGPDIPRDIEADDAKRAAWMLNWQRTTPAGKAWKAWSDTVKALRAAREASPRFDASIARDGTFRIDDVPEGKYLLSVQFERGAPGFLRDYQFEVPAMEGTRSDEPLDLGVLTLGGK